MNPWLIALCCLPGLFLYLTGVSAVARLHRRASEKKGINLASTLLGLTMILGFFIWCVCALTHSSRKVELGGWGIAFIPIMVGCMVLCGWELVTIFTNRTGEFFDVVRGVIWIVALPLYPITWCVVKLSIGAVHCVQGVARGPGKVLGAPFRLGMYIAGRMNPELSDRRH